MPKVRLRSDVTIGPLKPGHADDMFSWMLDTDLSANVGLTQTPSLDKTRSWIQRAIEDRSIWPYAIFLNARYVGNVVLDQADLYLGSARLSVYIGVKMARGSGVGISGIYYALRECFLERGLHKIWLIVHSRNTPAIRTYTTLGFQVEGVLRDAFLLNGARLPALYMGLLQEEFFATEVETT